MKTDARDGFVAGGHQKLLQVVTVELGAAEDHALVHLVLADGAEAILALQDLGGFGEAFWRMEKEF